MTKKINIDKAIEQFDAGFDTWIQACNDLIKSAEATQMDLVKQSLELTKSLVEEYRKSFKQILVESK